MPLNCCKGCNPRSASRLENGFTKKRGCRDNKVPSAQRLRAPVFGPVTAGYFRDLAATVGFRYLSSSVVEQRYLHRVAKVLVKLGGHSGIEPPSKAGT